MPLEIRDLTLGELIISAKGVKSIPLKDRDDTLYYRPEPLRIIWQPKAFADADASRVPVCFQATDAVQTYFSTLDDWIVKTLATDPKKYFGQDLTLEQIQHRYSSPVKTSMQGWTHLKAKMNLTGRSQVRCWDTETRKPRKPPADWTSCEVQPFFEIRGLWMMAKEFGLVVEMTDALITERSAVCPF